MPNKLGVILGSDDRPIYDYLDTLEKRVIGGALEELSEGFAYSSPSYDCRITISDAATNRRRVDKLKKGASASDYLKILSRFNSKLASPYKPVQIKYSLFLKHLHHPSVYLSVSWREDELGMYCEYSIAGTSYEVAPELTDAIQRNFDQEFS